MSHGSGRVAERAVIASRLSQPVVDLARPFSLRRRQGAWRDALLRRMLALADLGAAVAASVSLGIYGQTNAALWAAVFAPGWLVVAKVLGLYERDQRSLRHLTADELPRIFTWSLVGVAAVAVLLTATPAGQPSAGATLWAWGVASTACFVLRATARSLWRRLTPPERALVVGGGSLARAARRKLELFPDIHVVVAAERSELDPEDLTDELPGVDRIVLATSHLNEQLIAELLAFCRRRQVKLSVVPPARGMFGTAVDFSHVADLPVVQYNTWDVSRSTMLLKRALDIIVAASALLVISPLFVLIAGLIVLDGGRPVLFTQVRAGQHGSPFRMLKFRTMVANAEQLLPELVSFDQLEEPMFKLAGDPRVTRVGRLLRRASLDELPQFLNVLKGDMSLVGPRPEQIELVERYSEAHLFRLAVKPGMTGPMQIYGRGRLTFEERLAVERDYVENISVGRDLHILALTIAPVVTGRGAF
jgi:exopolysaccharide biosynthesis polyprenyl glycosylphosphotransferase